MPEEPAEPWMAERALRGLSRPADRPSHHTVGGRGYGVPPVRPVGPVTSHPRRGCQCVSSQSWGVDSADLGSIDGLAEAALAGDRGLLRRRDCLGLRRTSEGATESVRRAPESGMDLNAAESAACSESFVDRAEVGRTLGAEVTPPDGSLVSQLMTDDDLAVIEATAEALLRRRYSLGTDTFATAHAAADDQVGDHLNDVLCDITHEVPEVVVLLRAAAEEGSSGAAEALARLSLRLCRRRLGGSAAPGKTETSPSHALKH